MEKEFFYTLDGCRIAYRWDGSTQAEAPVLMLSNSLGTNMGMWDLQVKAWSGHFRILRYDSRGHGASDSPAGVYSMDRLGRDALELLDHLQLDEVNFCGLSLGGMVGQWMAVYAPQRLVKLVLANTSAYMGPPENWQARINTVLSTGLAPVAEASIARWFTPDYVRRSPDSILEIQSMLLSNDAVGYAGCCGAIRDMDMRAIARLNRTPTLVVAGSADPTTSVVDGQFLVDAASQAYLAILPSAHLSNVECPIDFSDHVERFAKN